MTSFWLTRGASSARRTGPLESRGASPPGGHEDLVVREGPALGSRAGPTRPRRISPRRAGETLVAREGRSLEAPRAASGRERGVRSIRDGIPRPRSRDGEDERSEGVAPSRGVPLSRRRPLLSAWPHASSATMTMLLPHAERTLRTNGARSYRPSATFLARQADAPSAPAYPPRAARTPAAMARATTFAAASSTASYAPGTAPVARQKIASPS